MRSHRRRIASSRRRRIVVTTTAFALVALTLGAIGARAATTSPTPVRPTANPAWPTGSPTRCANLKVAILMDISGPYSGSERQGSVDGINKFLDLLAWTPGAQVSIHAFNSAVRKRYPAGSASYAPIARTGTGPGTVAGAKAVVSSTAFTAGDLVSGWEPALNAVPHDANVVIMVSKADNVGPTNAVTAAANAVKARGTRIVGFIRTDGVVAYYNSGYQSTEARNFSRITGPHAEGNSNYETDFFVNGDGNILRRVDYLMDYHCGPAPALTVNVTANRTAVATGSTVQFTATITNTGNRELASTMVTITQPPASTNGVTCISFACGSISKSGQSFTIGIGGLVTGETKQIRWATTVASVGGALVQTTTASGGYHGRTISDEFTLTLPRTTLGIAATVGAFAWPSAYSTPVPITWTIKNTGNTALSPVRITQKVHSVRSNGTSSGTNTTTAVVINSAASLAAGASVLYTKSYGVPSGYRTTMIDTTVCGGYDGTTETCSHTVQSLVVYTPPTTTTTAPPPTTTTVPVLNPT